MQFGRHGHSNCPHRRSAKGRQVSTRRCLRGEIFVDGHPAIFLQISPVKATLRPSLFCEPKGDSFLKDGPIASKLGRSGEVLAVLQGPWKVS